MQIFKILFLILTIVAGVFLVMYAGADDSPGGQLIGLVVVVGGIVWLVIGVKNLRKG